jgi:hypothetical protein
LTLATASGTGASTLHYNYADNPGFASRRAPITISDRTYTVIQAGATLSNSSATVAASASAGTFSLSLSAAATWTAISSGAVQTLALQTSPWKPVASWSVP